MVAGARDRRDRARALPRPARSPARRATCSSSTSRRRCPPRCPARAPTARARRAALRHRRARPRRAASWWIVELRTRRRRRARSAAAARASASSCPAAPTVELVAPYARRRAAVARARPRPRAAARATSPRHGHPIRYGYVPREWPLDAYQTVFAHRARQRRDAERRPAVHARAGHARSPPRGVLVAPLTLHTGVSSLERGEAPYPERYDVPEATARLVNAVRGWGGRVIAVGTTVVRALETVAGEDGTVARRRGLDPARRHARARPARRRRADHRLARARGLAPAAARGRRRPRAARAHATPRRSSRLPLARVRRQPPHPAVSSERRAGGPEARVGRARCGRARSSVSRIAGGS